jgi:hypothetical protein
MFGAFLMRSRYYSIMNDTPENVAEWFEGVAIGASYCSGLRVGLLVV